jgi:hypothetical protein
MYKPVRVIKNDNKECHIGVWLLDNRVYVLGKCNPIASSQNIDSANKGKPQLISI